MKLLRSRKALSPVVASIILIAVTVAVSIAVAAWMGALTIGFMGSSSITVTNMQFTTSNSTNSIVLTLKNTGTKSVTIAQVRVNNNLAAGTGLPLSLTAGQANVNLTITGEYANWVKGNPYKVELYDSNGQVVGSYQATAPS
jgi:flagellin-like protein